jgi:purine-nucleoside phosphorylase
MKQSYRLDDPRPLAVAPPQHAHTRAAISVAAAAVRDRFAAAPAAGIILGTGLGALAREIKDPVVIEYEAIPGFPLSTVESHAGRLIGGTLGGKNVVAMQGRFHLYEGYTAQQVSFPVRVMRELGAQTLVVSNASGGLNPEYRPGDLMLIGDHLNLLGDNPLIGANDDTLGPRFPDMSAPYSAALRELAKRVGSAMQITLREGVYAAVTGPSFETRAEYRFLRTLGADAVGMSTVPEVLVAVHGGMQVLGISMITDLCLPDTLEPVTLERIVAVANEAEPKLTALVRGVLERL